MDDRFLRATQSLSTRSAGTESRAWLLYSLVRMTRPQRLLEIGVGHTTLFLLQAIAENVEHAEHERRTLEESAPGKADILAPEFYARAFEPRLVACDRDPDRVAAVEQVAKELGLDRHLQVIVGDFRGCAARFDADTAPIDFAFFDCGGPAEYVAFLREFWPKVNRRYGQVALDYTYWLRRASFQDGSERSWLVPGSIVNEIMRQHIHAGLDSRVEVLSLVEPNKRYNGSLTLVRRLPPEAAVRDHPLSDDLRVMDAPATTETFQIE